MSEDKQQRKVGVLAKHEQDFIRENCEKMSIHDIAEHINRTPDRVKRFIRDNALVAFHMDEKDAYRNQLRYDLLHKHFWPDIKKQFNQETGELDTFINTWVDLMESLQDVRVEEEMQLKQFIVLEILLGRSLITRNEFIASIDKAEAKVREEAAKPNPDPNRIEFLEAQVENMKAATTQFNKETVMLQERQGKIAEQLKATRASRISKVQDSKTNWAGLVRRFDDWQEREKEGRQIGIMQLAAKKAREKLSEVHIYEDGMADLPLLNSETVENLSDDILHGNPEKGNDDAIQS